MNQPLHLPRRQVLRLATLAAGAAIFPAACRSAGQPEAANPATSPVASPDVAPQTAAQSGTSSRVVMVRTSDRVAGTQQALDLLQPDGITDQSVLIKPNYNTGDPAPAATDTPLLEALVKELQTAGAGTMSIGDRSGMAATRAAMEQKGVFQVADQYGLDAIVFDDLPAEGWQYVDAEGTHWQQGFAVARPVLDAGAVVNTCCLKTHRFGGHFTLSLKNSVGLVAKYVPGDDFNYMGDLHSSPHQRLMIAEINAAYQPALVLLDGVEAFVKGGPANGEKVQTDVILAGTDRVAVDVVALGILRSLDTTAEVANGSVWDLEQIQRAVELGLGASSDEQIEIVTADASAQRLADEIRPLMA